MRERSLSVSGGRSGSTKEPPVVEYIIQSYDTAYSKKETADYSVITTWGVFQPDQDSGPNIILLDSLEGPVGFP
jgi:hypothetical protein